MDNEQNKDIFFMRSAIEEAREAFSKGEVPIGAVIVNKGRVIARGHNMTETLGDPTAHAEMQAITSATNATGGKYLNDSIMYVTVEPCPMCAAACYWAQIGEIVYGTADTKRGYTTLNPALVHPKTKVRNGVLKDECEDIMTRFFHKLRK